MKRLLIIFSALVLLSGTALTLRAQVDSKLVKAAEKIARYLEEKKPEWKRYEVAPISGSEDVVITKWVLDESSVSVSVSGHKSDREAVEEIQRLATDKNLKIKSKRLGDEGYTWNNRGSIVFRKGNLTIYVNANAPEMAEEEALCSEFASLVDDAINARL